MDYEGTTIDYFLGIEFNKINGREYRITPFMLSEDYYFGQKKRCLIQIPKRKGGTNVFILDIINIGQFVDIKGNITKVRIKVYDEKLSIREKLDLEMLMKI